MALETTPGNPNNIPVSIQGRFKRGSVRRKRPDASGVLQTRETRGLSVNTVEMAFVESQTQAALTVR